MRRGARRLVLGAPRRPKRLFVLRQAGVPAGNGVPHALMRPNRGEELCVPARAPPPGIPSTTYFAIDGSPGACIMCVVTSLGRAQLHTRAYGDARAVMDFYASERTHNNKVRIRALLPPRRPRTHQSDGRALRRSRGCVVVATGRASPSRARFATWATTTSSCRPMRRTARTICSRSR